MLINFIRGEHPEREVFTERDHSIAGSGNVEWPQKIPAVKTLHLVQRFQPLEFKSENSTVRSWIGFVSRLKFQIART